MRVVSVLGYWKVGRGRRYRGGRRVPSCVYEDLEIVKGNEPV